MPVLCAMAVLAALSALPLLVLLQPGMGFDAHTQRGEYQHRAGSCCHLLMWKERCQASPTALAQPGAQPCLPQTLLQALWERWPCAGTGHGTVRAVLAQLLQLGSALAELGQPWPPRTPHFTAHASLLMPLQVCGVQ